jgi:effector-binding domain-containing protein
MYSSNFALITESIFINYNCISNTMIPYMAKGTVARDFLSLACESAPTGIMILCPRQINLIFWIRQDI